MSSHVAADTRRVLVLNPGSTSTKLAVYEPGGAVFEETLRHEAAALAAFPSVLDQLPFRLAALLSALEGRLDGVAAVVGRGGLLRPLPGGIYTVSEAMVADLRAARYGEHASNLGAVLAQGLAERLGGLPAFIADPVTTDELLPEARLSGLPEIPRRSRSHALNIKACARAAAAELGQAAEETRFVVAHLGGGISVAAVDGTRILDVNDALLGMGPFSPERAGALPIGGLVKLAFSGTYTEAALLRKLSRESGLMAYVGSNDLEVVGARGAAGDEDARLALAAMYHQIAKEIGAMATVLRGRLDGVVLTGGAAHSEELVRALSARVAFLGRLFVFAGENEARALAAAGFRALAGQEALRVYDRE